MNNNVPAHDSLSFRKQKADDIRRASEACINNPELRAKELAEMFGWSYMHAKRIKYLARFSIWMQGGPAPGCASGSHASVYLNELARMAQYIDTHPSATIAGIAEELMLGISSANRMINTLKVSGILSRSGSARKGTWIVNASVPVCSAGRTNTAKKDYFRRNKQ